jgi:hypothetical protein
MSLNIFTLVGLVFVVRALGLWVPCRDKWNWVEQEVLWLDVSVERRQPLSLAG